MKATEVAAWWGAVVASLVFIWDVYKWFSSGPKVSLRVIPNMKASQDLPGAPPDATYLIVKVTNNGDRATTIETLFGQFYLGGWRPRQKPDKQFVVPFNHFFGEPLPHKLEPGEQWQGGINQDQMAKDSGRWYVGIAHSASEKEVRCRVRFDRASTG